MNQLECFLEQHPETFVTLDYYAEIGTYRCRISDGDRVVKAMAGARESVNCLVLRPEDRTPSGLAIHKAICAWNADALNRAEL